MRTRWTGLGLVVCGLLAAVFFVYLPIRDGPNGFMGRVQLTALVFTPLSVVTGIACILGGPPVLVAFQSRRKSARQHALVLSIIVGSLVLTGLGYWQLKTRWLRPVEPVILDGSPRVPIVPDRR